MASVTYAPSPTEATPVLRESVPAAPAAADRVPGLARHVWAIARISLGWTFLWPFLDKFFGLGHETPSGQAWIHGGNPTKGFLAGSVGPFSGIYHDIAGSGVVNVLFMAGLFGVGVALLLGVAQWPAAVAGSLMLILMWSASLPPQNNLFMDDHIIYALVLVGLASVGAGRTFGLAGRWTQSSLVRRNPWLS